MRWFSNHESAARGEVSILAIIETLIAISISIGIAIYYDTTLHILISACIAPFLLLRTDDKALDRPLIVSISRYPSLRRMSAMV